MLVHAGRTRIAFEPDDGRNTGRPTAIASQLWTARRNANMPAMQHLEAGGKADAVALPRQHRKVLGNDAVGNQLGDIRLGNQVIISGKIT